MLSFAKQLVRSAEGIISNDPVILNVPSSDGYENYRGSVVNGQPGHYGSLGGSGSSDSDRIEAAIMERITSGFRVLRVVPGSSADLAGVESMFDFVIGINGKLFADEDDGQQRDGLQEELTEKQQMQQQEQGQQRPKSHGRSLSLASGLLLPQLMPPQVEVAPIESFIKTVHQCLPEPVVLDVWSSKGRIRRKVVLAGSSGNSSSNNGPNPLLGMALQWTPLSVSDHVWHILHVTPNSPAHHAGLISHSDYIVGAENGLLEAGGEDLLARVVARLVSNHQTLRRQQQSYQASLFSAPSEGTGTSPIVYSEPELELFVYNHDYNTLRAVRIRPNSAWGGTGLLGCGVGYGLLHRLPGGFLEQTVTSAKPHQQFLYHQQQQQQLQQQSHQQLLMRHGHGRTMSLGGISRSVPPPGGLLFDSTAIVDEDEEEEEEP